MTFDDAVAFVLIQEGGESDDPRDPGGKTRYGISQRAHPDVRVGELTRADAVAVYRRAYWTPMACDQLPPPLALVAFDAAVQHGVRTAKVLLQRALGVTVDGSIGPETLAAAWAQPWADTVVTLLARRAVLYAGLSAFPVFGFGWCRRLLSVHRACYESPSPGGA